MNLNKTLSLLGLAARSRNLVSGEFAVCDAVRKNNAYLVIVAGDASDNTKKMYRNLCNHYQVPLYFSWCKEVLGHAIGKEFRVSVAVMDQGFSDAVTKLLDKNESMEV